MESKKQTQNKDNKKLIIIGAAVAVVVIIVLVLVLGKGGKSKVVKATLGEPVWMEKDQTVQFDEGGNKVSFIIETEDNLVKVDGDYEYNVNYVLTVNEQEYKGSHRFGNGYSVHNEDNGIPYKIDIIDFENNTVEVSFEKNKAE